MKYRTLSLTLAAFGLSGCAGLTGGVMMAGDAAGIYATSPSKQPPADVEHQIPPHESWCYRTAGYPQCFAHPQNVPPERLINVDPANMYPVDLDAYHQALIAKPKQTVLLVPSTGPLMVDQAMMVPADVAAQPVMAMPGVVTPALVATPNAQSTAVEATTVQTTTMQPIAVQPVPVKTDKKHHVKTVPMEMQPGTVPATDVENEDLHLKEEIRNDNDAALPLIVPPGLAAEPRSP